MKRNTPVTIPKRAVTRDGYRIVQEASDLSKHARNLFFLGLSGAEILNTVAKAINEVSTPRKR